jgi:hypothetical protein
MLRSVGGQRSFVEFVLFLFLCPIPALSADVELSWDPSTAPNLAGYKVHYGASSRAYSASIVIGEQTTYTLRGLPAGTWYLAVTAYDAQGNESGLSNEVSTTVAAGATIFSGGYLSISALDIVEVTKSSAVIVWKTNRISDSQVEYGTTSAYGTSTAVDFTMVTAHYQVLNHLLPSTIYHCIVKSRDASGDYAISGDFTFATLGETPILTPLAENRTSVLSVPLFPAGAMQEKELATSIIFPEIGDAESTQIVAAKADPANGILSFELVGAEGTVRSSVTRSVSGKGTAIVHLSDALFSGVAPSVTDYLRVRATEGVQIVELLQGSPLGMALQGQDENGGATTLYAPHYFAGNNGKRCALSIVNLDSGAGSVTLRLVPDGTPQISVVRTVPIPPNGKIYIDDPEFFRTPALGKEIQGYVEVTSDGIRLAGNVAFSNLNPQASLSALQLASKPQDSVFLSNAFSNDLFFTGMLVLNPGDHDAYLSIDLYSSEGSLVAAAADVIPAKQRIFRSLRQYFPALAEQSWTSGYIRIVSDKPIAAFAQLNGGDLSVLSEIPPQGIP